MHNPARPVMEGSASLKMLLPHPLCKCLLQLMWHIPSSVSAGDAQRLHCLYRLQRVKPMDQPPAALCNNMICSLCSWLLPKRTYIADFCHSRKKCSLQCLNKQMYFLSCDQLCWTCALSYYIPLKKITVQNCICFVAVQSVNNVHSCNGKSAVTPYSKCMKVILSLNENIGRLKKSCKPLQTTLKQKQDLIVPLFFFILWQCHKVKHFWQSCYPAQ